VKQLRTAVAATSRALHAAGWCANHDGNVSARDGNRFIATPTATSKRLVADKDLIEVDTKGAVIGAGKVFGEIGLHLVVYERPMSRNAVVRASAVRDRDRVVARQSDRTPFVAERWSRSADPKLPPGPAGLHARSIAPWYEARRRRAARQPRRDRVGVDC
jgi:hypothetical protein